MSGAVVARSATTLGSLYMLRILFASFVGMMLSLAGVIAWMPPVVHRNIDVAKAELRLLSQVVVLFKERTGKLPQNLPEDFVTGENSLLAKFPSDPWGRKYVYRRDSDETYHFYSIGRNGTDESGEGDDVVNSEKVYQCEDYGVNCPKKFEEKVVIAGSICGLLSLAVFLYSSITLLVRRVRLGCWRKV